MMSVYEMLEYIRKRPGMFIGEHTLRALEIFVKGYQFALRHMEDGWRQYNTIYPLPFELFTSYCCMKFKESSIQVDSFWIVEKKCGEDNEKTMFYYYDLLDEFKSNAKIDALYECVLSKENIHFHNTSGDMQLIWSGSDDLQVKGNKNDFFDRQPKYKGIDRLYYVKLSYGAKILFSFTEGKCVNAEIFLENKFFEDCVYRNFRDVIWQEIDVTEKEVVPLLNMRFCIGH